MSQCLNINFTVLSFNKQSLKSPTPEVRTQYFWNLIVQLILTLILPFVFLIVSPHNALPFRHIQEITCITLHKKPCVLAQTHPRPNLHKQYSLQASYSGVTVPSFHSIRISPRCKVGEECERRMACSVSGALSLGTGDPGTLASGLGVYDFKTHTTFFLLAQQNR